MEWHPLNKNNFVRKRNEDKAGFIESTIMNSEKGNRILGNVAIDEKEIFKIMHEDTHTHTHIYLGFVKERHTRHATIVQDFCEECHRRLNKLEH
jgi:hypothetical protein